MRKVLVLVTLLLTCGVSFAQKIVTGRVTDEKGNSLTNVTVLAKGTASGTTSLADGSYSLTVPANAKVLVFSSVGFNTEEVTIGSKILINVLLTASSTDLDEVVVVAYGTQKKTAFTGSASTVKAEVLENRPVTSFEKSLQGQATGITVQSVSGQPGANSTVRIRGVGSFNASSEPLYVLDGVPITAGDYTQAAQTANILSTLDSRDIESISVLKDATAAGLYGSRAANGVIMITTKKGKAGKSSINFSAYTGVSSIAVKRHEVMTGGQYFKYWWDHNYNARIAAGDAPNVAATTANTTTLRDFILNNDAQPTLGYPNLFSSTQPYGANGQLNNGVTQYYDTDWRNAVLNQGRTQDYSVAVSGGNEKTKFYLSGGYFNQKGIVIASDFNRYAAKLNLENNATNFLKIGVNTTLSYTNQNTPPGAGGAANPIRFAELTSGIYPLYQIDQQGQPIADPAGGNLYFFRTPIAQNYNPVGLAKKNIYNAKTIRGILSPYLDVSILKNLKFRTQGTVDLFDILETRYLNPASGDGNAVRGRTNKFRPRDITLTLTNTLNYNKTFNKHGVEVLIGQEAVKFRYENISASGTTFPFDGIVELASAATPTVAFSNITEKSISSLFTRVNYNFDDKYFLTGSLRRDGSSIFGDDAKYGIFWTAGGGWRIGREKFLENVKWIDELKLKASYGISGNDNIGRYQRLGLYAGGFNYGGVPGIVYNQLANDNLQWEENAVLDIGIEGDFAKRFHFEFTYFNRASNEVLFDMPLSRLTGFTTVITNLANLRNKGIEVMLEASVFKSAKFQWVSSINLTQTKNVIEKMTVDSLLNGNQLWKVGGDRYQWFLREWAGVDPADGAPMWYMDEVVGGAFTGKRITTKNWNAATRYKNGSALPKFFGGFNNTFSYNNFELSILTFFSVGGKIADDGFAQLMHGGTSPGYQLSTEAYKAWKKPGDITDVPRFRPRNPDLGNAASTRFLFDGSYLRLKNVSLGYKLPRSVTDRLHISNARFFVSGENLATWAKHKGMDPEVGIGGGANNEIPIIKTISAGFNIGL
jgi:TonB-linked SusC/RagA family outer membrane protein